ncbi:MAG: L,D-transpeptidase family protein [Candidatus Omnitrophota bacterium]
MKKIQLLGVLVLAAFLMPATALAVETDTQDAGEKSAVATKPSQDAVAEKSAVVAAVSSDERKENVAPAVKSEVVQVKPRIPEDASALNSAELQRRWKTLFSKEITPDSIAYTVKSGDRLYILAKKNKTTVDLIKKINGLKSDSIYPKMKLKIHTAPFSIEIDKSKNVLILFSNGEAVKKYSVATGKKNCTPVGEFKITDKLVHPTWFKTGAILPPGSPENALGTRWMGFDKPSYGIHGTIEPKSIGTQASEGCIRMLNEEVEELYSVVPVGTKVTIQD